jgi:hypothetical protein
MTNELKENKRFFMSVGQMTIKVKFKINKPVYQTIKIKK